MIRPATLIDVPRMVALAAAMHAESRYADLPWDGDKLRRLIEQLIDIPDGLALVAVQGGEVVGGFIGMVYEQFFSPAKVASDFGLYVSPDRRGGLHAARLLKAYVAWARSRGVPDRWIQAGVTTGVNVETSSKLFAACGFAPVGNLFQFRGA